MLRNFLNAKLRICIRAILICAALSFMGMGICQGYIMPVEQIIQLMADNFSKFKTVVITQSTERQDQEGKDEWEEAFMEKIWMKSPDFFGSKILDETGYRVTVPDTDYRQLLIANSKQRLMALLSQMGIDLQSVAFTRIGEVIAYRIGDKGPDSPKFLVEKERFLPLFLKYRSPQDPATKMITVEFKNYRRLDQGWYPFEMTYSVKNETTERYTIHTLDTNVPIDPALFHVSETKERPGPVPEEGLSPLEEERLREIIKRFEEKYR